MVFLALEMFRMEISMVRTGAKREPYHRSWLSVYKKTLALYERICYEIEATPKIN